MQPSPPRCLHRSDLPLDCATVSTSTIAAQEASYSSPVVSHMVGTTRKTNFQSDALRGDFNQSHVPINLCLPRSRLDQMRIFSPWAEESHHVIANELVCSSCGHRRAPILQPETCLTIFLSKLLFLLCYLNYFNT
ncbi:unnamed protein product [Protopolystoma xenopodis]|uniref:Uncharacterized protein n=1 Tax=Protopolystoma xenopodis TaxID=117903 RepID=A0A448X2P7_9PLAT|nr:unnamed protein product [Protopolystoma xenopodis]